MTIRILPTWADELRRRYLRGEASIFVLHGNVYDAVISEGRVVTLTEFLGSVLLDQSKETIAVYNVATGVRFLKRDASVSIDEALLSGDKPRVLMALERMLTGGTKTAVVLEYAEAISPAGDPNFQSESDRAAVVTLHRWSFLEEIERSDNIVILIAENLTDLAPKLVSNPRVAVVEVPMPDVDERKAAARVADKRLDDKDAARYAEITAGLKAIQIISILTPPPASEEELRRRQEFISSILTGPDTAERAAKIAALTVGLDQEEIAKLIAPGAQPASIPADCDAQARKDVDLLIARRKREILERECFGLVEFVEPAFGFEVVGGMEEVKQDLLIIANSIRNGERSRVPMGILFTGPMGTGKTFVAEAFARECGLTTIKLKNFRSKWVGATEGNLEKILNVIRALGQVVVIVDEGDRAFGNTDGEGDGGTSSRVIARIKEFMSDTSNRGRILFLVMTNRPDKLDVDLKRAGRLDRKIPFLYSQTAEEVEAIAKALVKKNQVATAVDFPSIRETFSQKLIGYSNADVEAVILMANDDAARAGATTVSAENFNGAATDYFPSRDSELLEYMELLAVFEASSRRLLPPKYASMTPDELDLRMRALRAVVGSRR
ncbi:MAG TPA: AAA family ATPase [Thermoanaerobaculia bacterium]|nr:AAA family ATPase [Thermoanaerobaculia bacterium]